MYPSSISPKPLLIATYLLLVYVGQVGYCALLVMARKTETKVRNPEVVRPVSQLTSGVENHNERGGNRLGTRQLDHGVLGRRLGKISFHHIHSLRYESEDPRVSRSCNGSWCLPSSSVHCC
jgi:hypothetical protein